MATPGTPAGSPSAAPAHTPTLASAPASSPAAAPKAPKLAGETGDSPQRAAQQMHGAALTFDLAKEIEGLHQELSWQRGDRNAKTLVQEDGLRVVLIALKAGTKIAQHEAHAQATVHVIAGRVLAHLTDRTLELHPGGLLSLEASVPHEIEAPEESAFLLTLAGPGSNSGSSTSK